MASVLTREIFQDVVDRAVRDVIPQISGITLLPGGPPPSGEVYTIHTQFDSAPAVLALCAEGSFLNRMTRYVTRQEQVTPEERADAATELFNVLCGHVVVELYRMTRIKTRFRLPQFSPGLQIPAGHTRLFVATYHSGSQESIQMIQLKRPVPEETGPVDMAERSKWK